MPICEICRFAYSDAERSDRRAHKKRHDEIVNGVPSNPLKTDSIVWCDDMWKITVIRHRTSPIPQKRLAENAAFRANFDTRFDLASYHADEVDEENTDPHVFLLHTRTRIVGMLVLRNLEYVGNYLWEEYDQRVQQPLVKTNPMYSICMIWIHERHRRRGLASLLVSKAAEFVGTDTSALGWYTPFTETGEVLARSLCPTSFYIAK